MPRFEKIPAETSPVDEQQRFLEAVELLSDEDQLAELEQFVSQATDPSLRRAAQLVLQRIEVQKKESDAEVAKAQAAEKELRAELDTLKQEKQLLTEQIEQLKVLLIEQEKRPQ